MSEIKLNWLDLTCFWTLPNSAARYKQCLFTYLINHLIHYLISITRSYKTNLHRASIRHGTLNWQNTIKKVNAVSQFLKCDDPLKLENIIKRLMYMSQILKYVGYTKPTLAMYVLHNLHGQSSQYHDFIFSLNIDRDGVSLISVGTRFHNWGAQ